MSRVCRGIVRAFDATAWTVDVQLISPSMVLYDVPLCWHVDSTQVVDGVYCMVLVDDNYLATASAVIGLYRGVAPDLDLEFAA